MSFPYYLAILIVLLASVVPGGLVLQTEEEDMSQEELHIAKIERWILDAVLGENPTTALALDTLADPFIQHTDTFEVIEITAAGPLQYFWRMRSFLDDVEVEILHTVAQDDLLVWHFAMKGVWARPVYAAGGVTVEPTGEEITIEQIHISRMEDGKIAEGWTYTHDPIETAVNRALIIDEVSDE